MRDDHTRSPIVLVLTAAGVVLMLGCALGAALDRIYLWLMR